MFHRFGDLAESGWTEASQIPIRNCWGFASLDFVSDLPEEICAPLEFTLIHIETAASLRPSSSLFLTHINPAP
jgi:hypothetical protein